MNFDYSEFQEIAERLHTMVDVKIYTEYNFAQVTYMTDKFGGSYASYHIDLSTGVVTLNYGYNDAHIMSDMNEIEDITMTKMQEMLEKRDLKYISDMINSEYD